MRAVAGIGLLAAIGTVAGGPAWAEPPGRIVAATATSTRAPVETNAPARLFDRNDVTAWCAREPVKVRLTLRLDRPTRVETVHLALGHLAAWRANPRVKQVFVTISSGGETVKKIRHKWPDRDEPREGRVNVGATGDLLVVDFDQAYAGSAPGGLCVASLRLMGGLDGAQELDATDVAATLWSDEDLAELLRRTFRLVREIDGAEMTGTLELTKRGRYEYEDASGVRVSGRWAVERGAGEGEGARLVFRAEKVRVGKKKLDVPEALARHVVEWRWGPPAPGEPPALVPWVAYGLGEGGALEVVAPREVKP